MAAFYYMEVEFLKVPTIFFKGQSLNQENNDNICDQKQNFLALRSRRVAGASKTGQGLRQEKENSGPYPPEDQFSSQG